MFRSDAVVAALREPETAPAAQPCAPLVKWVGGKARLLPKLAQRIPAFSGRYFEPFAGGAALFFHLARPGSLLSDANPDLMHAYRTVAAEPERVIRRLRWMEAQHRAGAKHFYYQTREQWNADGALKALGMKASGWSDVQRAAAFLYLNRTGYNGIWRVNRTGELNTPMGSYRKDVTICDPDRIRAAAAVLQQSTLLTSSWRHAVRTAVPGDLVYFDPPYVPVSQTANFVGYTPYGFGLPQQRELAAVVHELAQQGVAVIVSNSNTAIVRQLYKRLRCDKVWMPRYINSAGDGRGVVTELLISGGFDLPRRR
jgi:DNA adenine methylase